jgi:phage FluMu protein Com
VTIVKSLRRVSCPHCGQTVSARVSAAGVFACPSCKQRATLVARTDAPTAAGGGRALSNRTVLLLGAIIVVALTAVAVGSQYRPAGPGSALGVDDARELLLGPDALPGWRLVLDAPLLADDLDGRPGSEALRAAHELEYSRTVNGTTHVLRLRSFVFATERDASNFFRDVVQDPRVQPMYEPRAWGDEAVYWEVDWEENARLREQRVMWRVEYLAPPGTPRDPTVEAVSLRLVELART